MFTGIIEEIGRVRRIQKEVKSVILTIQGDIIFDGLRLGDSISVNGVCLTVSSHSSNNFTADIMRETLDRSSLGSLVVGSRVNMERAMPANGRFGGHIVSGHIDGTGVISTIKNEGNAIIYRINASEKIMKYIVEKGSIAIDGISLTVAGISDRDFHISVIPHTLKNTILSEKRVGDIVNLENDVLCKYVEKLMNHGQTKKPHSNITQAFLLGLEY